MTSTQDSSFQNQDSTSPQAALTQEVSCTQCGGSLHPDEGQIFLTCPFCGTTVYLDKSRVVFHWYVAPTLQDRDAQAALFRWMSGSQTVKDLDKKARVTGQTFLYFPLWYFKHRSSKGEVISLRPAAATSVTELSTLHLPAGDLKKYDSTLEGQSQAPTVPLEAGLEWLLGAHGVKGPGAVSETSLVHVPVYLFKYEYQGQSYTALVDAASGTVLANLFPAKAEAPYLLVAGVTALVYLCLALIPIVGGFTDGAGGMGIGLGVCVGLGGLAAPFLFAWAFWVASKV
jgi:predicted RNA-binding Zn-ribbon protein involved in translation (DUF1610 family)